MKPVTQNNLHKPKEGIWGDCYPAAIASVLELSLDEVPHFYDQGASGPDVVVRIDDFFEARGLKILRVPVTSIDVDGVLQWVQHSNPGQIFLLTGKSKSGVNHVVVAGGGKIIHDPSINQSGIIGPCVDDDHYWVEFIIALPDFSFQETA